MKSFAAARCRAKACERDFVMGMRKFAAAAVIAAGASSAHAVTIDFTDTSIWVDGASTQVVNGATVSLASNAAPIVSDVAGAPGPVGPLLGLSDGLGIGNDEVTTFPNKTQAITVTFSGKKVRVIGLYFLDTFIADDGTNLESVVAEFSGGEIVTTDAIAPNSEGVGFVSTFFEPITAETVRFTASADGNDNIGQPDFALAGIEIAVIPLPSSALLFISALVGMGALSRKRRAV